jgi:hypothetical protein
MTMAVAVPDAMSTVYRPPALSTRIDRPSGAQSPTSTGMSPTWRTFVPSASARKRRRPPCGVTARVNAIELPSGAKPIGRSCPPFVEVVS